MCHLGLQVFISLKSEECETLLDALKSVPATIYKCFFFLIQ